MKIKVFTKRHHKSITEGQLVVYLSQFVRRRLWDAMNDHNIKYWYHPDPYSSWSEQACILDFFGEVLRKEHGWPELRAYLSRDNYKKVNLEGFIIEGVHRFIFDTIELFYDEMVTHEKVDQPKPHDFQQTVNRIFEEANLHWRMSEGRIFQVDSKFLEEEVTMKAQELMSAAGFEGAQDEFLRARSDLVSGDTKGAIANTNLALESTMKAILNVERIKPGELVRKMIDCGLVPDYFDGFLKAFEQILRSVPVVRNDEKGVGHGQGEKVNKPPAALAKLAIHLAGSMIVFLTERHIEQTGTTKSEATDTVTVQEISDDDVPF